MDTTNLTIGEIVKSNYKASDVFKKYGIDFCCGGNKTVAAVCKAKGLDEEVVLAELTQKLAGSSESGIPYDELPIDFLATHIQKKHHRYVEEAIPVIMQYLDKIVQVHGGEHPELAEIRDLFKASAGELTMHMKKEELMLFPYVQKLARLREANTTEWQRPVFGSVENPISQMEEEHEAEGDRFRKIAALSNHYTPPADACNTYMVAFKKLQEFEEDLHLHIHLENNILFPKAKLLERTFN